MEFEVEALLKAAMSEADLGVSGEDAVSIASRSGSRSTGAGPGPPPQLRSGYALAASRRRPRPGWGVGHDVPVRSQPMAGGVLLGPILAARMPLGDCVSEGANIYASHVSQAV